MKLFRFLVRHLKGERGLVAFAIGMTFLTVAAELLNAFPLKFMLDKIVHHRDPAIPLLEGFLNFFDRFGTRGGLTDLEHHTQLGVIAFSSVALVVLGVVLAAVSYIQLLTAAHVGQRLAARLRTRLFEHLQHLPLGWHGTQRTGDLAQRISGNVADIEKLVTDGLVDLLAGFLTLIGILIVMSLLNWQFTLLSMLIVPPLAATVYLYTQSIKKATKQGAKALGQVSEVATEDIGAITEIKAFTLEQRESIHFGRYVEKRRKFGFRAGRLQAEFAPLVLMLTVISTATIASVGSWIAAGHGHTFLLGFIFIPDGTLTVGTLLVFLTYSKQLYQPMRNLSKLLNLASSAGSGAERIEEVLVQPREIEQEQRMYYGGSLLTGDIQYRDVTFGYQPGMAVLKGIDLHIPVGRRIALVGLSGSGKTTMVKLIPRFYEIWGGSLAIDGMDNRTLPLDMLRRSVSLVLQDSVLFEGTIRDNIALGRVGATEEEIVEAAKQAHVHDTIMDLPGGYGAQVREQGKNFSSGQRQRLSIARAIVRDAPILILDEPTASLDVEAEAEVMRALDTLIVGRTVVMISHRLSTLGQVDEIVVLHAGRIVEHGTYAELKLLDGVFAGLLREQNRYNLERGSDLRSRALGDRGVSAR